MHKVFEQEDGGRLDMEAVIEPETIEDAPDIWLLIDGSADLEPLIWPLAGRVVWGTEVGAVALPPGGADALTNGVGFGLPSGVGAAPDVAGGGGGA